MENEIRVLMITSEWPNHETPYAVPFIVRQVENLRSLGLWVDVYSFRGKKNPLIYIKEYFLLHQLLSKNNYDLIHAQWGQSGLLALPIRIPLVVTFRGSDLEGIKNKTGKQSLFGRILIIISKIVAKYADEVIVVADHLAEKFPKRSYHVIPSGLDLNIFKPMKKTEARAILNLPEDRPIILFVANPDNPDKRYNLANSAIKLVQKSYKDVQLIIVHGKPQEKIPLYMNASDALLVTSEHEGSPNIVKEALACNLPIVSTNVGDVQKRIAHIEGCVICEDANPETIASGLLKVLRRGKRISGREYVLQLDDLKMTNDVIAVYQNLLTKF